METIKLFDLDSYRTEFEGTVLSCSDAPDKDGRWHVVLDQTVFFAEGGGQPSDVGTLGTAQVLHVSEKQGVITHHCSEPLEAGTKVKGRIDWPVRFAHMQIHCGEHILSGLIFREYGFHNVGFHMGHEFTTIDLDGQLTGEMVEHIETLVTRAISENVPVHASYPSKEELEKIPLRKKPDVEKLRVVEVEGYDWCGCCGTHVSHTGEIQLLKIIDFQRYKGGTRLFFLCGEKAFRDYQEKHAAIKGLAEEFSCKPQDLTTAVHRLQQELSDTKALLSEKNKLLFSLLGPQLLEKAPEIDGCKWVFLYGGFSADEMKAFASSMTKENVCYCTFFAPTPNGIRYALSRSKAVSAFSGKTLCQTMNKTFGGKGGGSDELACGNLPQVEETALCDFFQKELGL